MSINVFTTQRLLLFNLAALALSQAVDQITLN
jgi:hypothetical protein